jgi:hypothetical protein
MLAPRHRLPTADVPHPDPRFAACSPRAPLSMRRFAVVTTCHAAGYETYGRLMAQTFLQYWPAEVTLDFYTEGFDCELRDGRLRTHDLLASSPGLVAFKQRHADNPVAHGKKPPFRRLTLPGGIAIPLPLRSRKKSYRYNAVRFAHKTFAIFDAARRVDADVLIWVDADTRFFAPVTLEMLDSFMPPDCFVGCLRRPKFTEAGFVTYNLRHPQTAQFLDDFERLYTQDLLFAEREYHDAFLFDVVRERAEARGARSYDIAEGVGAKASHVLINSRLGCFMDHMKGNRKESGQSRAGDLVVARDETYWQECGSAPAKPGKP